MSPPDKFFLISCDPIEPRLPKFLTQSPLDLSYQTWYSYLMIHPKDQRDTITVGMIREIMEQRLESQILELSRMIRKGYNERHLAEEFLSKTIGNTLTQLDNLHAFAGLPQMKSK